MAALCTECFGGGGAEALGLLFQEFDLQAVRVWAPKESGKMALNSGGTQWSWLHVAGMEGTHMNSSRAW